MNGREKQQSKPTLLQGVFFPHEHSCLRANLSPAILLLVGVLGMKQVA